VIDALQRGEDLPAEWQRELFPPEKREYELVYHGKEREEDILANTLAVPLQPVRTFGKDGGGWHNMLIFGDNLQVMKGLLDLKKAGTLCNADGTPGVRLVYIDPPFATREEFRGTQDQKAYQDKIAGATFIEFVRKRIILLRELMSPDGTLYVHLDTRKGHYLKTILDEVFGESNFRNEIVWKRSAAHSDSATFAAIHDSLFMYTRSSDFIFDPQYQPYEDDYVDERYKHVERDGRKFMDDNLTATGLRGGGYEYKWKGIKQLWRCPIDTMRKYERENRIYYTRNGVARIKRYLEEMPGLVMQDVWLKVFPVNSQADERIDYPTQKPEALLDILIRASTKRGDLVIDAFAGSGTAAAVAEKLDRRWITIDCGKLAIYTMQKRMLNLRRGIGNKGSPLPRKPFTLYNAGLYDFSKLRQLPWSEWRFFGLQLFGCKDEPHTIGGLTLDGKLRGSSVLVFNHLEQSGKRIDEDTIRDIHGAVGKRVGRKFFIIAPRGVFDFQQDYVDLDGVRYYALRIPYSVINELHNRAFSALLQPSDETAVNETVDAVGFDFIVPPKVVWVAGSKKRKGELLDEACLEVKEFESHARIRGKDARGGLETLSMVMLDFDYDGKVFDMDALVYADQLKADEWCAWLPLERLGPSVMVVFLDIYGNEAREVIDREKFGRARASARKVRKAPKTGRR
jgi:site-specific DNA-methyltransferase (adenine-specific)/adenine-specific DNA-methyltransferase